MHTSNQLFKIAYGLMCWIWLEKLAAININMPKMIF